MANYRHPRRRQEFVAGRVALKQALLETRDSAVRICSAAPVPEPLLAAAQGMQVLPDDDGRPRLWLEDTLAPTQVSIAHAAGWAAAACSDRPIGIDIVEIEVATAVPDDMPWLAEVESDCRGRLRALLWGLREAVLKSGQISAKTVWSLDGVHAVPTCPAREIIACWPKADRLAALEVQIENKVITSAFLALSRSAMLVTILMPAPQR